MLPHVYVHLAPLFSTLTLDQSHMLGIDNAMYSLPRLGQDQVPAVDPHAITPRSAQAVRSPSRRRLPTLASVPSYRTPPDDPLTTPNLRADTRASSISPNRNESTAQSAPTGGSPCT